MGADARRLLAAAAPVRPREPWRVRGGGSGDVGVFAGGVGSGGLGVGGGGGVAGGAAGVGDAGCEGERRVSKCLKNRKKKTRTPLARGCRQKGGGSASSSRAATGRERTVCCLLPVVQTLYDSSLTLVCGVGILSYVPVYSVRI